jgi:hypothetical protein
VRREELLCASLLLSNPFEPALAGLPTKVAYERARSRTKEHVLIRTRACTSVRAVFVAEMRRAHLGRCPATFGGGTLPTHPKPANLRGLAQAVGANSVGGLWNSMELLQL